MSVQAPSSAMRSASSRVAEAPLRQIVLPSQVAQTSTRNLLLPREVHTIAMIKTSRNSMPSSTGVLPRGRGIDSGPLEEVAHAAELRVMLLHQFAMGAL